MACGLFYAAAEHVSTGQALYCAVGNAVTEGACLSPATAAGHWIDLVEFVLVVPLVAAVFSLFTSGLTNAHVRRHFAGTGKDAAAARRIAADLYKHRTGTDHPDAPGD